MGPGKASKKTVKAAQERPFETSGTTSGTTSELIDRRGEVSNPACPANVPGLHWSVPETDEPPLRLPYSPRRTSRSQQLS
mmetsp:Transcript_37644/g.56853  ORF Transcript_37644/g.56853 Transcript_37644/m.56853 type:complete len:80 (-) Transcript_37644:58-297(-)